MVEMRFATLEMRSSNSSVYKDSAFIKDGYGNHLVLQYRYPLSYEKIPDIGMIHERVSKWSDWIDVPTVTEG